MVVSANVVTPDLDTSSAAQPLTGIWERVGHSNPENWSLNKSILASDYSLFIAVSTADTQCMFLVVTHLQLV